MKISAINLFNTNKLQQNRQEYKPNFCSNPIEDDSLVLELEKKEKSTPLKKEDAQFILNEGERLLEQYSTAQTEDEKTKAISSYQKNIKETLDNGGSIQGTGQGMNDIKKSVLATNDKFIRIISPIKDDEPIYKGTRIECPLNIQ